MDKKDNKNIKPGEQANNHLHGVKLVDMLEFLVAKYGWEELEARTSIRIFGRNPSIKSSLSFLRRTPWAREKIEGMFLYCMRKLKGRK